MDLSQIPMRSASLSPSPYTNVEKFFSAIPSAFSEPMVSSFFHGAVITQCNTCQGFFSSLRRLFSGPDIHIHNYVTTEKNHPRRNKKRKEAPKRTETLYRKTNSGFEPISSSGDRLDSESASHSSAESDESSSDKPTSSTQAYAPTRSYLTAGLDRINQPAVAHSTYSSLRTLMHPLSWFSDLKESREHAPDSNQPDAQNQSLFDPNSWDGLPNGDFVLDITTEQAMLTGNLQTHWACESSGLLRSKQGSSNADSWEKGFVTRRRCVGVITCVNCQVITRPGTKKHVRAKQIFNGCTGCGSAVFYESCGATGTLHTWQGGVHYEHTGQHQHPVLPRPIHLLKSEKADLTAIIRSNPKTGAANLVNGAPGRPPVADISPLLDNPDRLRAEQHKIRTALKATANAYAPNIKVWIENNPKYARYEENSDEIEIICIQSPFMATLPLADQDDVTDPQELEDRLPAVNGLLTDGAHGFWKQKKSILIVTSCYSKTLLCWVPVLIAYSNGRSAEHYKRYFGVLISSLVDDAKKRSFSLDDMVEWALAGVCFLFINLFVYSVYIGCQL